MSDVEVFQGIGMPGWFVILASVVFILERIGLFKFLWNQLNDKREFEQGQTEADIESRQKEQVTLWTQMTKLQTKALDQNELLLEYIISTSSDWHKSHGDRLDKVISGQQSIIHEIRQLSNRFTIITGIIENERG